MGTGPTPTGTVTFYVGTSVVGPWTQVGAFKALDGAGQATSDPYTPPATGTYYFYVSYSGDSNYLPSESDPADEVLIVGELPPPSVGGSALPITLELGTSNSLIPWIGLASALFAAVAATIVLVRRRKKASRRER